MIQTRTGLMIMVSTMATKVQAMFSRMFKKKSASINCNDEAMENMITRRIKQVKGF